MLCLFCSMDKMYKYQEVSEAVAFLALQHVMSYPLTMFNNVWSGSEGNFLYALDLHQYIQYQ